MSDIKLCPFCGEEIKEVAIKCKHCGSILSGSTTDQLFSESQIRMALAEKYEIIEILGKGGMATVYKANQKNLNRPVALKIVHPNLVHDTEFLNRFHREAQLAAALNHPNIVMIYDEGELNGVHYIAMEYLDGEDLHKIIREKGKLQLDQTVNIIAPIAEALDFAHKKGLVHRDVKTANIFITKDDRAVLTDFGIAHAASGTKLTQAGTVIGTPEYMSPEQAEGKPIDGRSDLFSLGIVLYECLGGKVPFKGDNPLTTIHGIIYDKTPPLKKLNTKLPGWMEHIVGCALAKSPEERFPTGLLLSAYLKENRAPSGSFKKMQKRIAKEYGWDKTTGKKRGRKFNRTLVASIIVVGLIMAAATVLYFLPEGTIALPDLAEFRFVRSDAPAEEAEQELTPDVNGIILDADGLYNQTRLEEALTRYQEAQGIDPSNQHVNNRIEEIQKELGDQKLLPELLKSADQAYDRNNYSRARRDYRKILEIEPDNEIATERIGLIDARLKELARDQNEKNFQNYILYGDSLYELEYYREAKTWYEKARRIKPRNEYVEVQLTDIEQIFNEQRIYFDKLIVEASQSLDGGKIQEARDKYSAALKLLPDNTLVKSKLDSLEIIIKHIIDTEINHNLVFIQGGTFMMGSDVSADDQKPAHQVKVTNYYMDKYEVTVKQYRLFCEITGHNMPPTPPWGWTDNDPVVNVGWSDAASYARWAGKRLPTEAEWEYAAGGGSRSNSYKYSGGNSPSSVAVFERTMTSKPKEVGSANPNELGLYDMSGNVWEWCSDYYSSEYYKDLLSDNPRGPGTGVNRVIRGGSFNTGTREILIKNRAYQDGRYQNSVGFRCVKNQ